MFPVNVIDAINATDGISRETGPRLSYRPLRFSGCRWLGRQQQHPEVLWLARKNPELLAVRPLRRARSTPGHPYEDAKERARAFGSQTCNVYEHVGGDSPAGFIQPGGRLITRD